MVWEVVRRNEIASANLSWIDAGDTGRLIHQALDDERGFWPAGAAVGVNGDRMGKHAIHMAIDCRQVILAGHERAVEIGGYSRRECGQICAHRRVGVDPQTNESAVSVYRHLAVRHVVAAMRVSDIGLGTRRCPFDRAADLHRGPRRDCLVRVVMNLAAETTANLRRNDPDLVFGQAQRGQTHQQAVDMGILGRHVEHQLAGDVVVVGKRGARLHRIGNQAVVDDIQAGDVRRVGKGGVRALLVANLPVEGDIVGGIVMHERSAVRSRLFGVRDSVTRIVINIDQFERVVRGVLIFGDNDRHSVTDVARRVFRQHEVFGSLQSRQQPADRYAAGNAARFDVLGRVDAQHAIQCLGFAGVDAVNPGVGIVASQYRAVDHPCQLQVIRVFGPAGNQLGILSSADG